MAEDELERSEAGLGQRHIRHQRTAHHSWWGEINQTASGSNDTIECHFRSGNLISLSTTALNPILLIISRKQTKSLTTAAWYCGWAKLKSTSKQIQSDSRCGVKFELPLKTFSRSRTSNFPSSKLIRCRPRNSKPTATWTWSSGRLTFKNAASR